jgi:hypothetical protein
MFGLALAAVACSGRNAVQNEEAPVQPVSFVKMNDAGVGPQLLSGFYATEAGAWRWTSGKFAVLLATPPSAAQNGGTVTFSLVVPEVVTQRLGTITLTASVNGRILKSSQFAAAGPETFTADVPPDLLATNSVRVDFALDKDLAPKSVGDTRELGIIAYSVGLAGK